MTDPITVLDYWLDEVGEDGWYKGSADIDADITARFAETWAAAAAGYLDHWIDETHFHWQSQNRTTPDSKWGREIIDHEINGLLVPPGDRVALAAALDRICRDRSLREGLRLVFGVSGRPQRRGLLFREFRGRLVKAIVRWDIHGFDFKSL